MTAAFGAFTEEKIRVGEVDLAVLKGGRGRPTLVLHGVEGDEGWLAFHEALAANATVYAPSHPGYGRTDCPEWLNKIQHMAVFYHWFLEKAALESVDLVGVGLGGWIATEMALMCTHRLRSLVLVSPAGILPAEGEVYDIFVESWRDVIERSFYDHKTSPEYLRIYGEGYVPQFGGIREAARIMNTVLAYKPYMYDRSLPGMLGRIGVPTLVVLGDTDRIMPRECGERFQQGIPGSKLTTLERCGHWAHLDRPDELAEIIRDFVSH
jgi:pimeloyl-ACP methyl ester carboxylesterase